MALPIARAKEVAFYLERHTVGRLWPQPFSRMSLGLVFVQTAAHIGLVQTAHEHAREGKGLKGLLGIKRLELLMCIWVADSLYRAHEHKPKPGLDVPTSLG